MHVCMAIIGSPWVSVLPCHLTLIVDYLTPRSRSSPDFISHLTAGTLGLQMSCFQPSLGASSGLANSDPQAYVMNASYTKPCPQTPSTENFFNISKAVRSRDTSIMLILFIILMNVQNWYKSNHIIKPILQKWELRLRKKSCQG